MRHTDLTVGSIFSGEAEQLVRDFLAPPALGSDLGQGALYFTFVVVPLKPFFHQILNPSGFLYHNGNRIVDLVSYTCRKFSDTRQLACFDDLFVHDVLGFVRPGNLAGPFDGS